jgi:hypothetical protein
MMDTELIGDLESEHVIYCRKNGLDPKTDFTLFKRAIREIAELRQKNEALTRAVRGLSETALESVQLANERNPNRPVSL